MNAVSVPGRVVLNAIGYRVAVAENMVVFSEEPFGGPCWTRMSFVRECGCWYVDADSWTGHVMVSHIVEAQKLLDSWFGSNFNGSNGENDL